MGEFWGRSCVSSSVSVKSAALFGCLLRRLHMSLRKMSTYLTRVRKTNALRRL